MIEEVSELHGTHSTAQQCYSESGCFTHPECSRALSDCLTLFLYNILYSICDLHTFCIKYIKYNIIIRSCGTTLQ